MKEQSSRGSQYSPKRTPGQPAAAGAQPSKPVGPGALGPPPAPAPRQAAAPAPTFSTPPAVKKPAAARTPTHDQIAARARSIWQAKGCKSGQDAQNWHEAETQLKAEMKSGA